jgi:outer membrane murein-binding lipoprotein Lpp
MAESDDLRAFIRDLMARFDRGMDAVLQDLAAVREEQRAAREESRRYLDRLDAKTDEIIAEGRAGREALFRILDELRGNGGTAPAS